MLFGNAAEDGLDSAFLQFVEELVPSDLNDIDLVSWLCAPIGGAPLHRRLLEPLLELRINHVQMRGGRVSKQLNNLWQCDGCFGMQIEMKNNEHVELGCARIRGDGLAVLDNSPGPKFVADALYSVDSSRNLRRVALAALEGVLGDYPLLGTVKRGLRVSPQARVASSARATGTSAIGAGSFIADDVRLRRGAIIGTDCFVGPGAIIEDAVLLDGTRAAAGEYVRGVVRTQTKDLY